MVKNLAKGINFLTPVFNKEIKIAINYTLLCLAGRNVANLSMESRITRRDFISTSIKQTDLKRDSSSLTDVMYTSTSNSVHGIFMNGAK